MQLAPKSYIILAFLLVILIGCRNPKDNTLHPEIEKTAPKEKLKDSSNYHHPPEPAIPGERNPGRAREKSKSELDTLLPIKA